MKKHKEHHSERKVLNLTGYSKQLQFNFDYEINFVKPEKDTDLYCKMYYKDEMTKTYRIINYNTFRDKKKPVFKKKRSQNNSEEMLGNFGFEEIDEPPLPKNVKTASCLKRLVSKKKRRFQTEDFDLDLTYITDHVIAMGFPSTGCEKMYRNSITDVISFFTKYHDNNVKVYNLCLEMDRIYDKSNFCNCELGLFPATDHNPCPIKLILEFCIDICLYLIRKPDGVAAIHCKAGKGRTGVMICSYLIFSELCEDSNEAFEYYARIRTKDCSGVTIPSQKRYIKYFETFLESNFCKPYKFLIPTIIKTHFMHNQPVTNILRSLSKDRTYFNSPNDFLLKGFKIGPAPPGKSVSFGICDFVKDNMGNVPSTIKEIMDVKKVYYYIEFNNPILIHSDIKISICGFCNFYVWVNLWYSSWEKIKSFFTKDEEEGKIDKKKTNPSKKGDKQRLDNNDSSRIGNYLIDIDDSNSNCGLEKDKTTKSEKDGVPGCIFDAFVDASDNTLFDILCKLKHNTDLNEVINKIKEVKKHIDINQEKMSVELNAEELDKFIEKNTYGDIGFTLFYSLVKKK